MKRPMLAVGLSFAAATWVFFFFGVSPLLFSAACALTGFAVILIRRSSRVISVVLLSAALAFGLCQLYQSRAITPLESRAGERIKVKGIVTEVQCRPPAYTLTLRAEFSEDDLPTAYLNVRGYGELEFLPGDGLSGYVQLEELRSSHSYHHSRGVFMGARLLTAEEHTALSLPEAVTALFTRMQNRMVGNLYDNLPQPTSDLLAAMALGARDNLDDDVLSVLNRSGTVHLISVSGLHLSVLIGCLQGLFARLKLGKRLSSLLCAVGAFCFAMLVGFSPSITRALVMMLIWLLSRGVSQRSDSLNSLGVAMIVTTLFAPHWVLSKGFWLSFSSTFGIVALSPPLLAKLVARYKENSRVKRRLANLIFGSGLVSLCAYAFSLPVLLVTTGWVTIASPVANALISPLITPALVCGMLCAAIPGIIAPVAWLANACTGLIVAVSKMFANIPFTVFTLDDFWRLLWVVLVFGVVAFLLYTKAEKKIRLYGVLLLAFAFAVGSLTHGMASCDKVEVIALEGCSSTILLRENSAVLLGTPTVYEIGKLGRYLEFRGVEQLDVILAHDQGEQIGSSIIRLGQRHPEAMIFGPDDGYVLGQLARAIPGSQIYSCGYATMTVLGGVQLKVPPSSDTVHIMAGSTGIIKNKGAYTTYTPTEYVHIWQDGVLVWTPRTPPAYEPVGAMLFGERRLVLTI